MNRQTRPPAQHSSLPERELLARREIGRTEIARFAAALLVALFLATLVAVPWLQATFSDSAGATEVALQVLPEAFRTARHQGVLAANRVLLEGIERFEETLEQESLLRRWLLPPTQRLLTEVLGVGNEQVVVGRSGWLFLRDDFEYVTGRGFLDRRRLRHERLASDRTADPLPAILAFDRDLAARNIELVVMPTPVKPTVHPEFLAGPSESIQNSSFGEFVDRLRAAGVTVFDPSAIFAAAKVRGDGPLYLQTDTHWTPPAIRLAASELAAVIESVAEWKNPPGEPLFERAATVAGPGDLARLLEHPKDNEAFSSEKAEISRVLTRQGLPWQPDREAEVLLLGDSFTNIYSDPSLGWGTGAGLAEHLSLALGRSVDRIALNAGGAWSSRQALVRSAATDGGNRLSGKRVVVYQFATRELSIGDWKLLPLASTGNRLD
jgi:alginate O-acetyltransferase complex protein AlgJ